MGWHGVHGGRACIVLIEQDTTAPLYKLQYTMELRHTQATRKLRIATGATHAYLQLVT